MKNQFKHNEDGTTSIFYSNSFGETLKTVIDTEDFPKVNELKGTWFISKNSPKAKYRVKGKVQGKSIYLYRLILNAPPDAVVDHIDGDTLNNSKANLRIVHQSLNAQNRKASGDLPRNVSYYPRDNKYRVTFVVNNKRKSFGLYETIEEAEKVAIEARRKYMPGATE